MVQLLKTAGERFQCTYDRDTVLRDKDVLVAIARLWLSVGRVEVLRLLLATIDGYIEAAADKGCRIVHDDANNWTVAQVGRRR